MQIKQICKPILDKLNRALLDSIPVERQTLYQAARYSFETGGKRIRPLIVILSCHDLGGEMDSAYDAALAIEMIHSYSLIHDDLPCMDDDDLRRGRPSIHKAFDEATAVLCGDFLLTEAFSILAKSEAYSAEKKVKLISTLTRYSGGEELLMGQMLDLKMVDQKGSLEELNEIYFKKTASLFSCALEFGAILADKGEETQNLLREIGRKIGMAFQIQNDFLGQKKDLEQKRFTIFSMLNQKQARMVQRKYFEEALSMLEEKDLSFSCLKDLFEEVLNHEV